MKTRYLLIILAVLLGGYFLTKSVKAPQREKNFEIPDVALDTAAIDMIKLYTKAADHKELQFVKQSENWFLNLDDKQHKALKSRIKAMIYELSKLDIDRVVTSQKDNWEEYEVTDSSGSRVMIFENDKKVLDLYIGKLSFVQNPTGMQQQQPSGLSYIRFHGQDEVLVVNGFLPITFNQQISSFRDNSFIRANKENITKIEFEYPSDSSFTLKRVDSAWWIGEDKVNTAQISSYLSIISNRNLSSFADDLKMNRDADFRILISGNNMQQIEVKVFELDNEYYFTSSLNPEAVFKSGKSGVFEMLFKGRNYFMKSPETVQV